MTTMPLYLGESQGCQLLEGVEQELQHLLRETFHREEYRLPFLCCSLSLLMSE
jgi:hypothetical protein